MGTDSDITEADRPERRDLWTLPGLKDVRSVRVRYRRPRRVLVDGVAVDRAEGVELQVQTDGEIPIRALSPAIFVGDTEIADNVTVDTTSHRFLVQDEQALSAGDEIRLGWVGQAPQKPARAAGGKAFRYEPPTQTIDEPGG